MIDLQNISISLKNLNILRIVRHGVCHCVDCASDSSYGIFVQNLVRAQRLNKLVLFLLLHRSRARWLPYFGYYEPPMITMVFKTGMAYIDAQKDRVSLVAIQPQPQMLRMVFGPVECGPSGDYIRGIQRFGARHPTLDEMGRFIARMCILHTCPVEVYLIDGFEVQRPPSTTGVIAKADENESAIGKLAGLQTLVNQYYTDLKPDNRPGRATIEIKTRADYLQLGVFDEIDEEELEQWRLAEDQAEVERRKVDLLDAQVDDDYDGKVGTEIGGEPMEVAVAG
jgi:hypothetical protein